MALLCAARLLVAFVPLRWWRATLGQVVPSGESAPGDGRRRDAIRLASHVERAAQRLPFETKCLPRAMALAWLMQGAGLAYRLKIAVRPAGQREAKDGLHAWVESEGAVVLGDLPGPWVELLTIAAAPQR